MKQSREQILTRNVHDELGPLVSLLKLQLQALKDKGLQQMPCVKPDLLAAERTADLLASRIRDLTRSTEPGPAVGIDPVRGLADFCNCLNRTGKAGIVFYQQGIKGPFPANFSEEFLRIGGELINNAVKHSGADQISVQVLQAGGRLSLSVEDNGVGFDREMRESVDMESGQGLASVKDRCAQLGGTFTIETLPGKGVFVNVEFNLRESPPVSKLY